MVDDGSHRGPSRGPATPDPGLRLRETRVYLKRRWVLSAIACALALASCVRATGTPVGRQPAGPSQPPPVATFSIVARDPATGELGVAVASKFFAVGAVVPWARAGVGAVATQAYANTTFGPRGLELLALGETPEAVVAKLTAEDAGRDHRQLGMVDAQGRSATFTGAKCSPWAGGIAGEGFACQGNILAGEPVVKEMARAFQEGKGTLADRLLAALEAAQAAGGDSRGRQSAALFVVRAGWGYGGMNDRYLDLRVDDHPDPVAELRRLYGIHLSTFGRPDR
ncbi:MAG: DUF1028 domain-containing protein [Planctomycetes bacterium]|nr:DUF1028 domain-containing protein [Planctomycetota bacterium]